MSTGPLRQSKRLRRIAALPEGEVRERRGANVTEAQTEVTTKVCVSTGTQTSLAISHPAPSLGAESGNLVGSSGERANRGCNYRKFLLQRRPRDSGLGERTVADPDDSGEEAGARERSATYPPLPGSRAESRLNLVEAGIEGAYYCRRGPEGAHSLQWDSGDLREDAVELRATSEPEEGTSQEGSDWHGWRSQPISSRELSLASESVDEEELSSESVDEVELANNDCPAILEPEQKNDEYTLWTNRRSGIKFQGTICGRWTKINHITTDFFGQKIIVPETIALDTSVEDCNIMGKLKKFEHRQMHFVDRKWTLNPGPPTSGTWFSTVSPSMINCALEDITLIRQGDDNIIDTPLGKANVSHGSHTHNHLTLIWDKALASALDNTPKRIDNGEGHLIKTSTPETYRLEDETKQLGFHIKRINRCITAFCQHKNDSFTVIGDEHLFVTIHNFNVSESDAVTQSSILGPQQTGPLSSDNRSNSSLDYILRSQNKLAAHVQFVRDKVIEQENYMIRTIRNTQFELIQTKRTLAISAAQYDGWLAANILQLPESTNGWELATYRKCYWRQKYVKFHGKHHVYRNGTWTKAEATLIQPERDWPTTFRYDDDNTYEYEPQANPAYDNWAGSHMNIVADTAAAMVEQNIKDNGRSYPIKTLILTPKEKADISNYVTWWETIKIILALIRSPYNSRSDLPAFALVQNF
ncbi:Uncharacterized protein APZ42_025311 [Daphnia magna]|uniref:Uncharacterized protein n=1 Tax=Daphnia magna TaxID=35525 RepID=A0A164T884_9CRUS|nr:Uncharacterized protein APZ42_025311 [Daphnia magna]